MVESHLLPFAQTQALRISQQLRCITLARCYNLSVCCATSLLATGTELDKSFISSRRHPVLHQQRFAATSTHFHSRTSVHTAEMQTQRCLNRPAAANCHLASISRPAVSSRSCSVRCSAAGSSQDPLLLRVARGEGAQQTHEGHQCLAGHFYVLHHFSGNYFVGCPFCGLGMHEFRPAASTVLSPACISQQQLYDPRYEQLPLQP